jgi:phosphoribosyl-AMP cyclohydrolase
VNQALDPDFSKGLIPAIAQDAVSGEVLMVAYMDEESWRRTQETGRAWFHSRQRGLWEKGATSGNYLDVQEIWLDCDQDCVLLKVKARGPACHTGKRSCFSRRLG